MHKVVLWVQTVLVPMLGAPGMFVVAFLDSSFLSFPEINDILLVTSSHIHPERAWLYAVMTTLGSVTGCLVMWELGRRGGEAFLAKKFGAGRVQRVRQSLQKWGVPPRHSPSFRRPCPSRSSWWRRASRNVGKKLAITLLIARGLRYAFWAADGDFYGDEALEWLERFDAWFADRWAVTLIILGGIVVAFLLVFWSRSLVRGVRAPERPETRSAIIGPGRASAMKLTRLGAFSILGPRHVDPGRRLLRHRVLAGGNKLSDHLRLYTRSSARSRRTTRSRSRATSSCPPPSARCCARSTRTRTSWRPRSTHPPGAPEGSYYGLGITVQSLDGNITVVSPFEGTPAARLGIRAGDVISKIENEDARGMAIDDAVKRLRGPKGTPVHITIVRQGYDTPLEFTVLRDEIALRSVPYFFMASKKTGYIRLTDFNETTACRPGDPADCEKELEKALRTLTQQGATSMILDIRDNPGGLLDQAFAVSNLFLKKGQMVVFTRGRTKRDETSYVTEEESKFAAVPLIVLTSKHSASASEIVAGAIQDHDRGLIVGETTFGKGLVQTIMPLRNVR
jgi:C-terminal peptidase prc